MANAQSVAADGLTARGAASRKRLIDGFTIPMTVVIALFIVKLVNPISYDPDLYWHLEAGQYIVQTMTLPYADVFSYTAYGKDWVLHEWLAEVLFYGVTWLAGLKGLWAFVAAFYAATFFMLYHVCGRLLGNGTRALVIALLFFAPFIAFATPRPQIFTYLLFTIYLAILIGWKYDGNVRALKLLPPLMVLWVNLHGAAIVGIALLGLFVVCEGVRLYFTAQRDPVDIRAWKRLALWSAAAALATLANPRFVDYWLYPFYVLNLKVATSVINEWKSPDFHSVYFKYFLVLFLGHFAALVYARRRPDLTEFAIPLFFIAAGFTSVRHLPLACLAAGPFFALSWKRLELPSFPRGVASAWVGKARLDRDLDDRHLPYLNLLLLCGVVAAMVYNQSRRPNEGIMDAMMPVKAADFVASSGITGRMFNEYGHGGYLMYRLYPRQKVFIDGRADMYGDEFMKEYLAIIGGKPAWKEKFDRYAIDFAVLPRQVPLRQLLLAGGDFKLVYDDERYSVLVRNVAQFSRFSDLNAQSTNAAASAATR
jgi:hypothetical protein